MKKEYIIPIFVPHLGCPNDCTFCNQKKISGQKKSVTGNEVKDIIEYYLNNFKDSDKKVEVAFFGGSFTGIDTNIQEELLSAANEYIADGRVDGIRISTRPDYINQDILDLLKRYNVKTIELGVQSANDFILNKCKRGHSFEDVKKASKLIRKNKFYLGHQMMVGLPDSTQKDEIETARKLIKLHPKMVRIYPVLVIKDTKLAEDYFSGEYKPNTVEQAVETCAILLKMFRNKNIDVIRIGLQNTDEICNPENESSQVVAGPYHPAFRQLVESRICYDEFSKKIQKLNNKVKVVRVKVNGSLINNFVGHKRENIRRIKELYDVDLVVEQDDSVKDFEVRRVV
ncbi:MAG: radical SAM protein [Clostridia bacterium]|nr:radical SAM protein [Clostridia bacterium]MBR4261305.1 radical SAM protein [Clostridia bacterium]